jgi:hypothetical protein
MNGLNNLKRSSMKAKLINRGNGDYKLYVDETTYATTSDSPYKKLSKQNCDEIFGVVDVERLAEEYFLNEYSWNKKNTLPYKDSDVQLTKNDFIKGFNKHAELNKDKVFNLSDMKRAFNCGRDLESIDRFEEWRTFTNFIDSLQPIEIEVEIVMDAVPADRAPNGWSTFPKLDSNGCLILKRYEA